MKSKSRKIDTLLTHAGRDPEKNFGAVNPPVYHASTILYPTVKSIEERSKVRFAPGVSTYGRHGTPTTFALEDAVGRQVASGAGHREQPQRAARPQTT